MKEFLATIENWNSKQQKYAIARVIKTWGSSPRPMGSVLLINDAQEMVGSVSGGCVEGDVVKAAQDIIKNGGSKQLNYGVSNEEAWTVGLSCGGKLDVFIQEALSSKQAQLWETLSNRLSNNLPCILVSRVGEDAIEDGSSSNTLILEDGTTTGDELSEVVSKTALETYQKRKNSLIEVEGKNYFIQVFARKSQLLIIGAAHLSADLTALAKMYDFESIVIDPRAAFAQKTQFPIPPDQIIQAYPSEVLNQFALDAYSYAVILSHDPKIDDNALEVLLRSDVAYIGALGSKRTHAARMARLLEKGFADEERNRIQAPIGVNIKAKSPKEIALSIMGQIIEVKNAFV